MEEILSIKIVSVDHYTYFPIPNLDTTHSDFRQSAVKQVPVVRIFGITSNPRRKICANVHGIFPYFYIPCAETDIEKINKYSADLAAALDKSINISLGQSTSNTHHVYKIAPVRGVYEWQNRGFQEILKLIEFSVLGLSMDITKKTINF